MRSAYATSQCPRPRNACGARSTPPDKGARPMYTFDYQRPSSTAAAASSHQGDTRYLAGGQSLVQAMKLRLSSSERLVDLGGVETLKGIRVDGANVVIGAMTTHAAVAISSEVRRAIPALADLAG